MVSSLATEKLNGFLFNTSYKVWRVNRNFGRHVTRGGQSQQQRSGQKRSRREKVVAVVDSTPHLVLRRLLVLELLLRGTIVGTYGLRKNLSIYLIMIYQRYLVIRTMVPP